jgi:hypothetical protein
VLPLALKTQARPTRCDEPGAAPLAAIVPLIAMPPAAAFLGSPSFVQLPFQRRHQVFSGLQPGLLFAQANLSLGGLAAAALLAVITPSSGQDSKLKAALTACMTRAVTHPLSQMLDVDNPAAVVYACEGQPALALFTAMEPVSSQTVEGDVIARRARSIVCSSHGSKRLTICTMTIEATAPFAKQVR